MSEIRYSDYTFFYPIRKLSMLPLCLVHVFRQDDVYCPGGIRDSQLAQSP